MMIAVMIVESGVPEEPEASRHVFDTPARGAGARLIGAQRSTLGETLRAVAVVGHRPGGSIVMTTLPCLRPVST